MGKYYPIFFEAAQCILVSVKLMDGIGRSDMAAHLLRLSLSF